MPTVTRLCLALGLAWAGGFGGIGPWWSTLAVLAAVAGGAEVLERGVGSRSEPDPTRPGIAVIQLGALALLATLLARSLARVVIDAPASVWALVPLALGLTIAARGERWTRIGVAAAGLVLSIAAALAGARFEAAGPSPRGAVLSGPIIGVHPRQLTAVRIDGFGPHDILIPDYVEPEGRGYDPSAWARRLELELHTIAERVYAEGPARARQAYARAEVRTAESIVPAADRASYPSLTGVEVRSGTVGEGSSVEFACPGRAPDPRPFEARVEALGSCPQKYVVDGSTGLGLSRRWPGHTRVLGRDRLRLARLFSWGDPRRDPRAIALESGLATAIVLALAWAWAGVGARQRRLEGVTLGALPLAIAGVLGLGLALAAWSFTPAFDPRGGSTLAAALVLALPARSGDDDLRRPAAWLGLAVLAGLALSPLGARHDAVDLAAAIREGLALDAELEWSDARAIAATVSSWPLIAALVCCAGLAGGGPGIADRERRHMWLAAALVLGIGLAMVTRKPLADPALLHGAALVLLATRTPRPRGSAARRAGLAIVVAAVGLAPFVLDGFGGSALDPVSAALVVVLALLAAVLAARPRFFSM